MRDPRTSELVESIVQISRQKNGDDLRISLLKTIMEVLDAERVSFFHRLRAVGSPQWQENFQAIRSDSSANGYELKLHTSTVLELNESMRRSADSCTPIRTPDVDGHWLYVHPVVEGTLTRELIVIRVPQPSENEFRLTRAIVQLYQNYLTLVHDSERDTLTGLLNRRSLESSAARLLQGNQRGGRRSDDADDRLKFWLAVIDVDHFKRVNDSFGHLFGDEVLLLISRLMQQCFRGDDLLYRFGGEEFVVILQAESEDAAEVALERYRAAVAAHRFPQLEQVTVSIGSVRLVSDMLLTDAIGHADQALYFAKAHGRNQICRYERLVGAHQAPSAQLNNTAEMF